MIHNAVVRHVTNPTPPDDEHERAEFLDATAIITRFNLHCEGITYQQQGYRTLEGDLPARIIDEYLLCKRLYAEAQKAKPQPKPMR